MAKRKSKARAAGRMLFTTKIFKGEDGFFVAYCEELPGIATQGKSIEEVRSNFKEALFGYLEALWQVQARDHPGPPPRRGQVPVKVDRLALEPVPA